MCAVATASLAGILHQASLHFSEVQRDPQPASRHPLRPPRGPRGHSWTSWTLWRRAETGVRLPWPLRVKRGLLLAFQKFHGIHAGWLMPWNFFFLRGDVLWLAWSLDPENESRRVNWSCRPWAVLGQGQVTMSLLRLGNVLECIDGTSEGKKGLFVLWRDFARSYISTRHAWVSDCFCVYHSTRAAGQSRANRKT